MKYDVIMVGPFPPPLHGMASVNLSVYNDLVQKGKQIKVLNTSARNLKRTYLARLGRAPRVILNLFLFMLSVRQCKTFYSSVSGGWGKVYEIVFLLVARACKKKIFLHHHCFSYLNKNSVIMKIMARVAGKSAVHITQSPLMAEKLKARYGVVSAIAVSNAVFMLSDSERNAGEKKEIKVLGFISNIAREKGIFVFLDLMQKLDKSECPLRAKIAGPFQDSTTENAVLEQLKKMTNVEYVGPIYGADKVAFFKEIDVLVFPTCYVNETEGIVNHEAMSHGVPVIAYGRGCIPEIINQDCGLVIDPKMDFVPPAMDQLIFWLKNSDSYEKSSKAALDNYRKIRLKSSASWSEVVDEMIVNEMC